MLACSQHCLFKIYQVELLKCALDWGPFLQVSVPDHWIDSLFPEVRRIFGLVQGRNARLQTGKRQADDRVSDRATEGFLQTVLYTGICFWQNLPFRTRRYA